MRVAVMTAPGEVGVEDYAEPTIVKPTDAIIALSASCICGSDLWPYRGVDPLEGPRPMGHEYCGIVEEVGSAVTTVKPGQFVVGSFFASDNTCEICRSGYQPSCPTGRQPPRAVRRLSGCGCRWLTAPWSPPPSCRPRIWYRTCWPPPTCWVPAGSPPSPLRPAPAKRLPSSATAQWGCLACWLPGSSGQSGSSR